MLHPYEIHIPAAKITPTILHETFGSPSHCPLATHFKERGYTVLVGGMYLYFFPRGVQASIFGLDDGTVVDCAGYTEELLRCSEEGRDFEFPISLPEEIINAVPGKSIWRRKR